MRAMVFDGIQSTLRLDAKYKPLPLPGPHQVQIRVHACGVCRTDLHVVDGELPTRAAARARPRDRRPVAAIGAGRRRASRSATASAFPGSAGPAASAPIASRAARTCATAPASPATTIDGGYAEYTVADERFCFPIPAGFATSHAAPLLCAGLIGYRALRMAGRRASGWASTASAPPPTSSRRWRVIAGREVYAFTSAGRRRRPGLRRARWAPSGPAARTTAPPEPLDAAIIFAPVGALVPAALRGREQGRRPWSAPAST